MKYYDHKTAQGRKKIYRIVAESFIDAMQSGIDYPKYAYPSDNGNDVSEFVCDHLAKCVGQSFSHSYLGENGLFPEFFLFKNGTFAWWPDDDQASRVFALLFSIEMCDDKELQKHLERFGA